MFRKNVIHCLLHALAFACLYACARPARQTKPETNGIQTITSDKGLYTLSVPGIRLQVDANLSGRITSLQLNGQEVLGQPDTHPENYGSTFWPSPQRDWGWPPYPALDGDPYQAVINHAGLQLLSGEDSKSGLQFGKNISLRAKDTLIRITYTIKNISATDKQVAPWEVTRVPSGGLSFFPKGDARSLRSNLAVQDSSGIIWFAYDFDRITDRQKLFMNGREGWLAHVCKGILLVKQFPDIASSRAAPQEEEVEIFAHENRQYIELENQGPYQTLYPGETLQYQVNWYVRTLPPGMQAAAGNKALSGYVRQLVKPEKEALRN